MAETIGTVVVVPDLEWEVTEDQNFPGSWRVESTDYRDGVCYVTIFLGLGSEARANEYAGFMNAKRANQRP